MIDLIMWHIQQQLVNMYWLPFIYVPINYAIWVVDYLSIYAIEYWNNDQSLEVKIK